MKGQKSEEVQNYFLLEQSGSTTFGTVIFWECCGCFSSLSVIAQAINQHFELVAKESLTSADFRRRKEKLWRAEGGVTWKIAGEPYRRGKNRTLYNIGDLFRVRAVKLNQFVVVPSISHI